MAAPDPGLYLITPPGLPVTALAPLLDSALSQGDIACVLLRLNSALAQDVPRAIESIADVVRLAQGRGAAVLMDQNQPLVRRMGADGVHLAGAGATLRDAIAGLKPEHIVGAGNLASRDDAMLAGECGVDYVMFGEPQPDGSIPPLATTLERVAWWSEIFTLPSVAFASDMAAVAALSASGADFVALGSLIWDDPRGPAAVVAEALRTLRANARSPV
jgi:thiamine-phosphate pyrophosphorylase